MRMMNDDSPIIFYFVHIGNLFFRSLFITKYTINIVLETVFFESLYSYPNICTMISFTLVSIIVTLLSISGGSNVYGFNHVVVPVQKQQQRGSLHYESISRSFTTSTFFQSDTRATASKQIDTSLNLFTNKKKQVVPVVVEKEESKFQITEPIFLIAWVSILFYAFQLAPGVLNSESDTQLLQSIINNPTYPENFNELAYFTFNLFVPLPLLLATLVVPNTSRSTSLPIYQSSVPYIIGSIFAGFFAIAPFLAFRPELNTDDESMTYESRSWLTKNIFENKIFAYTLIAFIVYLPFGSNLIDAIQTNGITVVIDGFINLLQTSRFMAVSNVDLLCCHLALCLYLIPLDYNYRNSNDNTENNNKALQVGAATALLPFLGPALYVATRPRLQDIEE